jgi:alkyldihydroxyacetonephosphate synthase
VRLDRESLLADVGGDQTLDAIESALASQNLTLGFPDGVPLPPLTVAAWLAKGAPGARSMFGDPADHLVAGIEATLANGAHLAIHPAPRRAVGPDLVALAFGTDRFARIDRAWLRVHERGARRVAEPLPEGVDLDPPTSDAESRLADAIARELTSAAER